jgi:hypothetical protein
MQSMQHTNKQYAKIQTSTGPLTFSFCTNKNLWLVPMIYCIYQCFGLRIRMFLGLPDPEVRDTDPDPDPSVIKPI